MGTNMVLTEFERDLLESVRQAKAGECAAVHLPDAIAARRRGRPVGSLSATRKASTTIRLPPQVLAAFKATGKGWQTRMGAVLQEAVESGRV